MKIALIGYGKMGHLIEQVALAHGHTIACTIDAGQETRFAEPAFLGADVAIEFSTPATAVANICRCIAVGIPVVSGTTGWLAERGTVEQALAAHPASALLWSSNFSVGVYIFNAVNRQLARLMSHEPQYRASIKEIHHIHKLDHPSGTAISLAQTLMEADTAYTSWTEEPEASAPQLPIIHERVGETPGTHIISWSSPQDVITIEHRALGRQGFALGAVMCAQWMVDNHPHGWVPFPKVMDQLLNAPQQ